MEDEFKLSLELSIGGCYGKSDDWNNIQSEGNIPGSELSCGKVELGAENVSESADLRKKREIQALRRREARMKRESKKSRALDNVRLTLMEDKLILEGQQFQTRVEERESREKDENSEELTRKREKNGAKRAVEELNVSISGDDFARRQMQAQILFPQVQYLPIGNGYSYPWVVPLWGANSVGGERNEKNVFGPASNRNVSRNSSVDWDSGDEPESRAAISSRSVERSSSVVSDYRSLPLKGGSSSETESHSSCLGTHQNQCVLTSDKIEHLEVNHTLQTEPGQCVGQLNPNQTTNVGPYRTQQPKSSHSKMTKIPKPCTHQNQCVLTSDKIEHLEVDHTLQTEPGQCVGQLNPNQTTNVSPYRTQQPKSSPSKMTKVPKPCTQSDSPTKKSGVIMKPPKPPNNNQNGASIQQMPRVSTTGNGPNGKTITGFLYKYTKTGVCIMCVCHGRSFSPVEFVEHAGGVNITHPLKHITIVPSTL